MVTSVLINLFPQYSSWRFSIQLQAAALVPVTIAFLIEKNVHVDVIERADAKIIDAMSMPSKDRRISIGNNDDIRMDGVSITNTRAFCHQLKASRP